MKKEPPNPTSWMLDGVLGVLIGVAGTVVFFALTYDVAESGSFLSFDYWLKGENGTSRSDVGRNFGLLVVASVGVIFAILRWHNLNRQAATAEKQADTANKQQALAERGLITDRINKAIENLGSDNAAVCTGGISVLWRLIHEIPGHDKTTQQQDVAMILNVLLGFIRAERNFIRPGINNNDWKNADISSSETEDEPDTRNGSNEDSSSSNRTVPTLPSNIQMIITLFGGYGHFYRSVLSEDYPVHLDHLNLRGGSFSGLDIPYVTASASDMSHAKFIQANLSNGTMRHVNFSNADFSAAFCEKTNFSYSFFKKAVFGMAVCSDADFSYAHLDEADFRLAKCKNANFFCVKSKGSNFECAWFYGAKFVTATLDGETFANSDFKGAEFIFTSLKGAIFSYARLEKAKFNGSSLDGAEFSRAVLTGADFRTLPVEDLLGTYPIEGLIFEQVESVRANMGKINWSYEKLGVTNMTGVNLFSADLSAAKLTKANLSNANLREANLSETKMYRTNLTGADLTGAKGLTQEQINSAVCEQDNPPKLPDGLTPPTQTSAEHEAEDARKWSEEIQRRHSKNEAATLKNEADGN